MNRRNIFEIYAKGLLWIAFFVALATATSTITELIVVDFLHGNPHRTKSNAILMMAFDPHLFGVVFFLLCLVALAPSQLFESSLVRTASFVNRSQIFLSLLALPATSFLTWYCIDYLAALINLGDRTELSIAHYSRAVGVQIPIAAFNLARNAAARGWLNHRTITRVALAFALCAGLILGVKMAINQFQFLN